MQVTGDSCTVTSACIEITNLSIDDYDQDQLISLYSNPSNGNFSIIVNGLSTLNIFDLVGKFIYESNLIVGENIIQTQVAKGVYIITIKSQTYYRIRF